MNSSRLTRGHALFILACLVGSFLLLRLDWDAAARAQVRKAGAGVLDFFGTAATAYYPAQFLLLGAALAAGWRWGRRDWFLAGRNGFVAAGVSILVGVFIKALMGRPRPALVDAGHGEWVPFAPLGSDFSSYPSGHTYQSFAVAAVLAAAFPTRRWLFYLGAAVVGLSRICLDRHFFSDVLAGAALGTAIGLAVERCLPRAGASEGRPRPAVICGILIFLVALFRIWHAGVAPVDGDEAYFWFCGGEERLAWSYPDHPGLGPLLIRAGTGIFGENALGIRAGHVAVSILTLVVLAGLGRLLDGEDGVGTATHAVLLCAVTPILAGLSVLAYPYSPLFLGWAGCLAMALLAVKREKPWAWLGAGLFFAVALYSHLTAILLPVLLAIWLWRVRPALLRSPWPTLGLGLAISLAVPLIQWSRAHAGEPFLFQFSSRHERVFKPQNAAFWIGLQFGLVSPVLFAAAAVLAWRRLRDGFARREAAALLVGLGFFGLLPVFALHAALHQKFLPHWGSAAYLLILPDLAGWLRRRRGWVSAAIYGSAALETACLVAYLLTLERAGFLGIVPRNDFQLRGLADAVSVVERMRFESPRNLRVFSDNYRTCSLLTWRLQGHPPVWLWMATPHNGPAYARVREFSRQESAGWDAVFVGYKVNDRKADQIRQVFESVTPIPSIKAPYAGWHCRGFKGQKAVRDLRKRLTE